MILGVGIDLIEVARIQASYERFHQRFLGRIFRPSEIDYSLSYKNPGPHLAARFAAKEAISKAFGTGIGGSLGWQDLEVAHRPSGQPFVIFHGRAQVLLEQLGGKTVHLSLSHTAHHATAIAILES